MKKKIAILLSGRGSNMEAVLRNVFHGNLHDVCEVAAVVSNKKDARGLAIANGFGIPVHTVASKGKSREAFEEDMIACLEPYQVDYLVLAGFMRILSSRIISRYPRRIINIHPADTDKFRGLHGYQWAFENQLEETAVTVHFVDEGVDTGEVIAKKSVDLRGLHSLEEVEERGLQVEHVFYSEVLREVLSEGYEG